MRQRIDDRAKKPSPIPLEKSFKEIVVGTGRAQEPYIIAFHYASDNVAGHGLGTLFGFFEVEIHDQDAAYIVNFLASVAKKEYFANPRRTPTDSFDAALHKINVALAEIVKHGNITWLGHLHGAIGAVNGNIIHFSATGEGELYLAREGSFQSISQGLADTGSEPHPLKTFTEVSSGELFDGDLIIAFSPSVWSLFSPEDLMRSLNRLGPAGFEQFLRTALVNELPVAAAAILLCSAPVEIQPAAIVKKDSKKAAISLENVWSGKPFSEALESKTSIASAVQSINGTKETAKEEYTDKKTGHIYVQASSNESFDMPTSRLQESWGVFVHHLDIQTRSVHVGLKKTVRRIGKETGFLASELQSRLTRLQRFSGRRLRLGKRALSSKWQEFQGKRQRKAIDIQNNASHGDFYQDTPPSRIISEKPTSSLPAHTIHLDVKGISRGIFDSVRTNTFLGIRKANGFAVSLFSGLFRSFQRLSPKIRLALAGALIVITGAILVLALRTPTEPAPAAVIETPASSVPKEAFPPTNEPLSIKLEDGQTTSPENDAPTILLATINEAVYRVSTKSILNLQTQESTASPETLRLAAPMDDLDAFFVLGESGTLYLYSVTTKKFEKNTLPLPEKGAIDAIGAYLTYLYVFDHQAGTIHRFPRVEGGFGTPTLWSKEALITKNSKVFSVYENIALTDENGKPTLYSRGRNTGVNFSGTAAPVITDALTFNPKNSELFALDRTNKRVVRWSIDGTLTKQYFHESFGQAESITVSSSGTELTTSDHGAVATWRI